jgi:hypothetical protein
VSDQERDSLAKATEDESGDDVEAHKYGNVLPKENDEEGDDDVEAHKLQT